MGFAAGRKVVICVPFDALYHFGCGLKALEKVQH